MNELDEDVCYQTFVFVHTKPPWLRHVFDLLFDQTDDGVVVLPLRHG